ncbi:MAG: hypothetical protein ACYSWZ_11480 [Planctomycetota bacterium]|jgi:hypothetical protein
MAEESIQEFQRQNPYELIEIYIKTELEKTGIALERFNIDIQSNTCTATTDKEVPEEIIPNLREHVENKGLTIKFLHSQ